MKIKIKAIIAIAAATLCAFCPAVANADRVYFLVGVRHVYEIGPNRDLHLSEREEIEKNYADGVAEDQDTFNKHVANGADHEKESDLLNQDLDALADARDKSLGSLFVQRDDLRESHPDLKIQGDGPYQVIGIEMHTSGDTVVFDRYCAYAPWPGYVVVGGCYGDWDYGVWYEPGVFFDLYWGWWGSFGGFRFCPGFYGHFGRVDFAPHGFVDHSRFAGSAGRLGRAGGFESRGYSHSAAAGTRGWGSSTRSASGYSHSGSAGTRASGSTGYGHSGSSTGFGRSSAGGGYTHSSTGGFTRAATSGSSSRSTGASGYSHASSSGWSGHSRSTGASGYSHSSGSASTDGSRSGGFSRSSSSGGQTRGSSGGWGSSGSGGSHSGGGSSGSRGGRSGGGSGGHGGGR